MLGDTLLRPCASVVSQTLLDLTKPQVSRGTASPHIIMSYRRRAAHEADFFQQMSEHFDVACCVEVTLGPEEASDFEDIEGAEQEDEEEAVAPTETAVATTTAAAAAHKVVSIFEFVRKR
jgi:hypothetical protein